MKRAGRVLAILTIAIIVLVSISFAIKNVRADADYSIDRVSHRVEVLYNGYIFINDTITITGEAAEGFLIGFPHTYGPHVLQCVAYNVSESFPVYLNVPLENRIGFYGVKVGFPQGTPHVFTVGFVLSNDLLTQNTSDYYTFSFPAFPSLTKTATVSNVSIVLPTGAGFISGTVSGFKYDKENLSAFDYSPANLTFLLTGGKIQKFDIDELKREIRVDEFGGIEVSDTYYVKNKAQRKLDSIEVVLLPNSSDQSAEDQFGRNIVASLDKITNRYKVTVTLEIDKSTVFSAKYNLPKEIYIKKQDANSFLFNASLFQNTNYYVNQVSVTMVPPEGATILSFGNFTVTRSVFQQTVSMDGQGVTFLDNINIEISYAYNPLWLSFRPALWVWALAVFGCAVVVVWKRPKAPTLVAIPTVAVRLSPENLRSFVESYEERRKLTSEIESLETKVRKGKIPRRRYKVQRRTLEMRLNSLSGDLEEFRQKLRAAGGKYSDLMRQLEIAETEINEVEVNLRNIEGRHSRGDLSLEAYRKLLPDYQRRKEKAETTVSGILLRLREEIR